MIEPGKPIREKTEDECHRRLEVLNHRLGPGQGASRERNELWDRLNELNKDRAKQKAKG